MPAAQTHADRALVLKTNPYGESDLVCHLLLEGGGRRTLFARAARRSKKRFRGGLPSFAQLRVHFTEGRSGKLWQLRESEVGIVWHALAADLDRMAIGFHVMEILQQTLEEGQGGGALFDRVSRFLAWLDGEHRGAAHLATGHVRIQLLLLHEAGLLFDLERSTRSGRALGSFAGVVFAPDEGFFGVEEREPGDHATLVRPQTLVVLRQVAQGAFSSDLSALRYAQALLNVVWSELVGRELKSWRFLKETSGL